MNRRTFFARTALAGGVALARARAASFELEEVTAPDLQEGMRSGRWTARAIVEQYLARIEAVDRSGPRAVIEVNPDAVAIAVRLDEERRQGRVRGPLHGIPVLIKDNIDTADRMRTTAGSLALAESIAARDAAVVERLRAAGAVILGKTNLSEWANFRASHSTSGWSGRGGLTRNPYALDRNPCGSSSGSGAAVSANLCAIAVGTETDGSVVCPSSVCGVVGIKPTVGLVGRSGIIPIAHSQDTAGPMARTVRDAALLLGAMAGADPRDSATAAARPEPDYTRFLDPAGLRGARLGIARHFFGFSAAVDRVMETAIAEMKRQGAVIVDPADLPSRGRSGGAEMQVLLYEFKADLNAYLGALGAGAPVRSLAEVIAFNEKHAGREMPWFGQDIMLKAEKKGPLTEKAYLAAVKRCRRASRTQGIDAVCRKHRLDALVAPTAGPAWTTDLVNGDHGEGGCSGPPAMAGYPHITVPAGFVHGLPVGISFFGPAWTEPVLLKIAYGFEQAVKARRAPRLLPSIEMPG